MLTIVCFGNMEAAVSAPVACGTFMKHSATPLEQPEATDCKIVQCKSSFVSKDPSGGRLKRATRGPSPSPPIPRHRLLPQSDSRPRRSGDKTVRTTTGCGERRSETATKVRRENIMHSNKCNLNSLFLLLTVLSTSIFPHAAFGFGFDKGEVSSEVKGLGPRNSVDKLSEDEELEVSITEDVEIAISRNRNNGGGSDSLENSSSTPDKRSMELETHSSGLSRNDDDDEEDQEEVGMFQRGASNSSFSRRSSLRTAVRDKRSSRRNYSMKKKKVGTDPEKQFEPNQSESTAAATAATATAATSGASAKCWSSPSFEAKSVHPSPYSSLSSVSIMSCTAPVKHPKATDALPSTVRPEDLRLNLNSLDSSSACSDFKSMEGNSLEILESTHL